MLGRYHTIESWRMADFGKTLAELRKARGLTQSDLSDLLDVQTRLIGRWEQGQGKPQFDYILKLADTFEVSLDQLLRGSHNDNPMQFDIRNKKLKELCKKVDQLKQRDQDMICHFLDMAVRHERLKRIVIDPINTIN